MRVLILHNQPRLSADHPDAASESGVLVAVDAYEAILKSAGHETIRWPLECDLASLLAALTGPRRPDVVVNLFEGWGGQPASEAWIASLVEACGVPLTGSPAECLAIARQKHVTKWLLGGAGVPTAPFHYLPPDAEPPWEQIDRGLAEGPLFVKPAGEDASLGVEQDSVVVDRDSLRRQIDRMRGRYGALLIERYIPGREFNVGVLALPEPRTLPLAELEFRADPNLRWPILTYHGKWSETHPEFFATPAQCPAVVEADLAERIRAAALAAFRVVGCRDYARVDLRVTPAGEVFILEVNANPDTCPEDGFDRALTAAGVTHAEFVLRLAETAAARGANSACRAANQCAPQPNAASTNHEPPVTLRKGRPADLPALVAILSACGVFRPDEVDVGREVLEDAFRSGGERDFTILVAELAGEPVGWSSHGLVPMTDATYDLYWIAVHPAHQARRVGRRLLEECERDVARRGGRWLIAETSTTADYAPTRAFYARRGYALASDIPDFYRAGDGRAIFVKRLDGG